jgi:hypothetical protein
MIFKALFLSGALAAAALDPLPTVPKVDLGRLISSGPGTLVP